MAGFLNTGPKDYYLPFSFFTRRVVAGSNELRHKKTYLQGFRPGPTQIGLYGHIIWLVLKISDLGSRVCTLYAAKINKNADQTRSYRAAVLRLCFRKCKIQVFS